MCIRDRVYPGLGWVVWKDKKYLPDEMAFSVNYLGANITQVGLNFSRPAAQILGQYYNFIRLGYEGYREVQQNSMDVATYCHDEIGKMNCFRNYADKLVNPLFIWYMDEEYDKQSKWTLYDLQATLQQSGWMVPAYTLPKNLEDVIVMRIVCLLYTSVALGERRYEHGCEQHECDQDACGEKQDFVLFLHGWVRVVGGGYLRAISRSRGEKSSPGRGM